MESVDGLLKCETMSDEWFDVDQAGCDKPDGFGVLVGIAIQEANVYFIDTEVHKRKLISIVKKFAHRFRHLRTYH